jgi:hypothetical protein
MHVTHGTDDYQQISWEIAITLALKGELNGHIINPTTTKLGTHCQDAK